MATTETVDPAVELVHRNISEAKTYHDQLVDACERRYRAYRGIPEKGSLARAFTSQIFQKYLTQMVESMAAAIMDPNPRVDVRPRPKIGVDWDAQNTGARTLEALIDWALDRDRYSSKQRDNVWQALICGTSVAKVTWKQDYGVKHTLRYQPTLIHTAEGEPLATVNKLEEHSYQDIVFDGPCVEIRDIRDFYWPESAVDVQTAPWVIDRVWMTPQDAKALAQQYGVTVDDTDLTATAVSHANYERETTQNRSRTKGLVPVDERWSSDGVIGVINGKIKFRQDSMPYWHGCKPFVITSAMPEPFQFTGFSIVELVSSLQEQLWTLGNQRTDSLMLMSNMIMLMRADIGDIDSFQWAPGEMWLLEDLSQVKPLEINPQVAALSLEAESILKTDLRDIPGGDLFSGGIQGQINSAGTATQAALTSNVANRLVQARKQNFSEGHRDVVEQVGSLLQQYTRAPQRIAIAGTGATVDVDPVQVQGDFDYVLDVTDESVVRQERQAETQALWTSLAQVAQVAMLAGTKINWPQLLIDGLEKGYGVPDGNRYVTQAEPQAQPGVTPMPGQNGNGNGITNAGLAAGPTAPSNTNSLSPAADMQQYLAKTGGQGGLG